MPCVGERKNPSMGNFSKNPMYQYAARFCETQKAIMNEAQIDYSMEPAKATAFKSTQAALKEFYLENSNITPKDNCEYVYIPKLDTGEFPNINSRNIDIIQFFKQEVEAITGEKMTVSLDPSIAPSTEEFCNLYFGNISIEHLEPTNTMGVFERW